MSEHAHNFAKFPYPTPSNHLATDPTPRDQAVYVPSVTPFYAIYIHAQKWRRALPKGLTTADLNFLDPDNKLFRISHVMSSAGQALNQSQDCIITKRDRKNTIVIGDSGGYQIARNPKLIRNNNDRLNVLRWLESNADYAMTLDVPTGPVLGGNYFYKSVQDCLFATEYNLKFFQNNRQSDKVCFLNVLQGNTLEEADVWYDTVKKYQFEGWAFAGVLRHNYYNLCRRILIMRNEGQIQDKKWIHVLGTNELETAVLLTALQRSINTYINPNLRFSYDTSSPFRNIGWGNVYGMPRFDTKQMTIPTHKVLAGSQYFESPVRWPWPSPLGDKLAMGDVCRREATSRRGNLDDQSNVYLVHHNLAALCYSVAAANRAFDASNLSGSHSIAKTVGESVAAIDEIMSTCNFAVLERYRPLFAKLRHGQMLAHSDDEQRDLDQIDRNMLNFGV